MNRNAVAILFVKELMASSQIKEAARSSGFTVVGTRSVNEFEEQLAQGAAVAVVNLNIPGDDPFAAIAAANRRGIRAVAFVSHVDAERIERAGNSAEVYPRSKFFPNVSSILTDTYKRK